ncbi:MAG: hypothetical protein WC989_00335 [Micavibrio sp.]
MLADSYNENVRIITVAEQVRGILDSAQCVSMNPFLRHVPRGAFLQTLEDFAADIGVAARMLSRSSGIPAFSEHAACVKAQNMASDFSLKGAGAEKAAHAAFDQKIADADMTLRSMRKYNDAPELAASAMQALHDLFIVTKSVPFIYEAASPPVSSTFIFQPESPRA